MMYPQDQRQQHHRRYPSRLRLFSLFFVIILITISVTFAIQTQGVWATILSLILTALGIVLAFWQIAFSSPSKEPIILTSTFKEPIILPATPKEFKNFRDQLKATLNSSDFGALVVYANEDIVGCITYVFIQLPDDLAFYTQFRIQPLPTRTYEKTYHDLKPAYIAQHQINNYYLYAAVYPILRPATYHVELHSIPKFSLLSKTVIDIHPEQVSEIDWRDVRETA
jgi:predicted methyltransferase